MTSSLERRFTSSVGVRIGRRQPAGPTGARSLDGGIEAVFSRNVGATSEQTEPRTAPARVRAFVHSPTLRQPISLLIEAADDVCVAYNVHTGIYGSGASSEEAVGDFLSALHEHAAVLGKQERLSAPLQDQLNFLRARLVEPEASEG